MHPARAPSASRNCSARHCSDSDLYTRTCPLYHPIMPRDYSRSVSPDARERSRHRDRSRSPRDRSRDRDRRKSSRRYDDEDDYDRRHRDHRRSESRDRSRDKDRDHKSRRRRDRSESEEREKKKYVSSLPRLPTMPTTVPGASAISLKSAELVRQRRSAQGRRKRLVGLQS